MLIIHNLLSHSDSPIIILAIILSITILINVGYGVNRRHWGLLIPAWILTIIPIITTLSELIDSGLAGL